MSYLIENISNEDIKINNITLKPGSGFSTNDPSVFNNLIERIKVRVVDDIYMTHIIKNTKSKEDINKESAVKNMFNDKMHDTLMSAIFKLYTGGNINTEELDIIKCFFRTFYNITSGEHLFKLDNVTNRDEMVEILLNYVYPQAFSQWLSKFNK